MIEEQFKILKFMSEATGRIDTNELAQKIGLTSKQLIDQVHEMTKTGFLKKVGGGYSITEKGKNALKATRLVPEDKKFYFYNSLDQSTGQSASTVKEFHTLIVKADIASLEFHLYRDDFENWFRSTIKDSKLADELANIKKKEIKGEDLRRAIAKVVESRYSL